MRDAPGESDLQTMAESDGTADGPAPLFVARVMGGRDAGKTLVLDWSSTPRALVGQSSLCHLVLTDPRVSRRHVSLAPDGRAVRLTDLATTNGTRVGGLRVVEALLEGGETLEIGDTTLRLVRAGEQPVPAPREGDRFGRVLGRSPSMQRLFALAERVAVSSRPVLVEGEAGTGKALLAEAIHDASPRAGSRFVVLEAGRGLGDQASDLLFGRLGPGAFEQAEGGTLVIDDVGELDDAAQERLAHVLERGEVERGDGTRVRVDVRVIATTRRDLEKAVQDGGFREELLLRLTAARLEVPPLRARRGDVELLARHFWTQLGGASALPKALALQLDRHAWPGNVRELEEELARRVALGDERASVLPVVRAEGRSPSGADDVIARALALGLAMPSARQLVVDEFERRYLERALAEHEGNVSRAAASSGVTRRYFHMLRAKARPKDPAGT